MVMLGFFLCVRWRRRQHATPLNWESVRTSALFRSASGPRTPKSFRSARTETPGPLSPPMSQMSHTTSQSQYATAPNSATSPTRNGLGTARTNISPLLMVQTPPRSEESYHGHDEEYDPFADPLAMARLRPQLSDMSPTIRVSDTTLVDQAWAAKGLASKMDGSVGGLAAKTIHEDHDELLLAPPSLNPMAGRTNRLSNDSLPPLPQEDSSNVCVPFRYIFLCAFLMTFLPGRICYMNDEHLTLVYECMISSSVFSGHCLLPLFVLPLGGFFRSISLYLLCPTYHRNAI